MTAAIPEPASATKAEIIAGYAQCWDSMVPLASSLTEAQWTTDSICPGWQTKHALLHVTAAEIAFSKWEDLSKAPFDAIHSFNKAHQDASGAEILGEFEKIIAVRRQQFEAMSEADFDAPSWTAAGPGTYRRYMEIRIFDHWAHEQDIRVPLDLPGNLSGLGADFSLNEVHMAFGYLVGKRAGAPDGSRVTIHVTGPTSRDLHAVVDGRAAVVAELADPTAEVTIDFATFMLLCCGRIDPAGPMGDGRITLAGDLDLAERVATNLAFTL